MKATGVVRRVDDLGRIVIPKEIRKTLRIKEGTPIEIFTEKGGDIILKKYSPINELSSFSQEYVECLNKVTNYIAIVTDKDSVVAVSGISKKDFLEMQVSESLESIIEKRESHIYNSINFVQFLSKKTIDSQNEIISPIISFSEAIGSLILISKEHVFNNEDLKLSQVASNFLGTQMEI